MKRDTVPKDLNSGFNSVLQRMHISFMKGRDFSVFKNKEYSNILTCQRFNEASDLPI